MNGSSYTIRALPALPSADATPMGGGVLVFGFCRCVRRGWRRLGVSPRRLASLGRGGNLALFCLLDEHREATPESVRQSFGNKQRRDALALLHGHDTSSSHPCHFGELFLGQPSA